MTFHALCLLITMILTSPMYTDREILGPYDGLTRPFLTNETRPDKDDFKSYRFSSF